MDRRERGRLVEALASLDPPQSVDALADTEAIRRRADALDSADQERLRGLLHADVARVRAELAPPLQARLRALGLLSPRFEGDAEAPAFPLEVRVALSEDRQGAQLSLAVLLARESAEDVQELAALHGVEPCPEEPLEQAVRVAEAVLDEAHFSTLVDTLQPASRKLLYWLSLQARPLPGDVMRARAARLAEHCGEPAARTGRVLLRLGLVRELEMEGHDLVVVPADVRHGVLLLQHEADREQCATAWNTLREAARPAQRDAHPSVHTGHVLRTARHRTLCSAAGLRRPPHPLDDLLRLVHVIDPESGDVGELASLHLDTSTPESFARAALRTWLSYADDPWTLRLMEALGSDPTAVCAYLQRVRQAPESPIEEECAAQWHRFTLQIRHHLLLALGILQAGHWYPVAKFVRLFLRQYQLVLGDAGQLNELGSPFPREGLPWDTFETELDEEVEGAVDEAIGHWLRDFAGPLGLVSLCEDEQLVMTNPEALRVLQDGDPEFESVWEQASAYLGQDLELWLPLPGEPGARVCGVAPLEWVDESVLEPMGPVHFHDALRLARFSDPLLDGGRICFLFSRESVRRGEDAGFCGASFLLWLRVRVEDTIPHEVRSLFTTSYTPADELGEASWNAALREVETLLEQMRSWGEEPPLHLMEEIRAWGEAAVPVIRDRAEALVASEAREGAELRHLLLLAGELGDASTAPLVLRTLARTRDETVEAAAGAAAGRLGGATLAGLHALAGNGGAEMEKRLVASSAMVAAAVQHPALGDEVFQALAELLAQPDLEADFATFLAAQLVDTGHPGSEEILYALREQGRWMDEAMPFDDALWIAAQSPCSWGHSMYSGRFALIFPGASESAQLSEAAGVDALLEGSGVEARSILGSLTPPGLRKERG